jgi:hypothetical protein
MAPRFDVRVSHNVRMAPAYDFKLTLRRLEDLGLSWRRTRRASLV